MLKVKEWCIPASERDVSVDKMEIEQFIPKNNFHYQHHHHHLVLQPYVSLGLLCYSPPLVSILSFPSSSFNPHLS
jgi:hypothetical protein